MGNAQIVSVSGPSVMEVGIPDNFTITVSGLEQGTTVTKYFLNVPFKGDAGSSGIKTSINGDDSPFAVEVITQNNSLNFQVILGDYVAPTNSISIEIQVHLSSGTTITKLHHIELKGICNTVEISGPDLVMKCCRNQVSYSVSFPCDGNTYSWTYPSGWSCMSGCSHQQITLRPDGCTAGTVYVTVGRAQAHPNYTRSASMEITRPQPVIETVPGKFQLNGLCPERSYQYEVKAIYGASQYNWQFPPGFTILSGQGTRSVSVSTNNNAASGTISIQVAFQENCCAPIQKSYPAVVLSDSPPAYITHGEWGYSNSFYCDWYQVCAAEGTSIGPVAFPDYTETMRWTVSPPWYFFGGVTEVITPAWHMSPPIFGPIDPPLNGQLCVTAINCIGESTPVCTSFRRALWNYWCDLSNNYPEWCPCCEPPCPTCPPYMLLEGLDLGGVSESSFPEIQVIFPSEDDLTEHQTSNWLITPNPSDGSAFIKVPKGETLISFEMFDVAGRSCKSQIQRCEENVLCLGANATPGAYWILITTDKGVNTLKWVRL